MVHEVHCEDFELAQDYVSGKINQQQFLNRIAELTQRYKSDENNTSEKYTYEIWSKGYLPDSPLFHGYVKAPSFKEACVEYARKESAFARFFNEEKLTFIGHKLYDNKVDALASKE